MTTKFNAGTVERRIAYFISPHGYGHAARAAAIMAEMYALDSTIRFEIFTRVPRWFFQDSLFAPFGYHPLVTDIGLVQKTALMEDLLETLRRLDDFLPFDRSRIENLARLVNELKCQLIVCDIAPMGIAVAREANIPSLLVENFTWDWIYQGYVKYDARMGQYIPYLQRLFDAADYHVQTEPVCRHRSVDLTASSISRKPRTPADQIRGQLGIPDQAKVVMITMGGIPWRYTFLEQLADQNSTYFVIPGVGEGMQIRGNLALLPHHSDFFHPDLVNACDAVIGKVGYSTVAEVYHAGVPFGYIARPNFRESQVLAAYIEDRMNGFAIPEAQFQDGRWGSLVLDLLALPRVHRRGPNGAEQVARFIGQLL